MNKKAIMKISVAGIILIILVGLFSFVFYSVQSSAVKEKYIIGENVIINLQEFENYKLRIKTPSRDYIMEGSSNIVTFSPEEFGLYEIVLQYSDNLEVYKFEVGEKQVVNVQEDFENRKLEREVVSIYKDNNHLSFVLQEEKGLFYKIFDLPSYLIGKKNEALFYDSNGGEIKIKHLIKKSNRNVDIVLSDSNSIVPGIYKLVANINGEVFEKEFAYGLISFNTKKSIYKPGENAEIIFVVLNEFGNPICDAFIEAEIVSPSEKNKLINSDSGIISGECGLYYGNYETFEEGEHKIKVKSLINGNEVNFESHFLVKEKYEYEIIREAESKIDPTLFRKFDVSIYVESLEGEDYLEVREYVPEVFEIYGTEALISYEDGKKVLTWKINQGKADIKYSYSVPLIWPYLYKLGELEVNGFKEARGWYIAVDPVANPSGAGGTISLFPQACAAQSSSTTQYTFAAACDGTYPAACGAGGDLASCDDGQLETHTGGKAGGNNAQRYGGISLEVYNSSVVDCDSITEVHVCYEVWGAAAGYTCNIAVDNDGGSSFVSAVTPFSCATSSPGTVTCVDVTSLEDWSCSNFFGPSGTRARAVSQLYRDGAGGAATTTHSIDVLYFNVSYEVDVLPPIISVVSPLNQTYSLNDLNFSVSLNEPGSWCGFSLDGNSNVTMDSINSTFFNYLQTGLSQGSHNVVFACNDTTGNMNSSSGFTFFSIDTIPPEINFIEPLDIVYRSSSINLSVSTNKDVDECVYSLNEGDFIPMNSVNLSYFYYPLSYLKNGPYSVNVSCGSGISYNSSVQSFEIKTNFQPSVQRSNVSLTTASTTIPVNITDLSRAFLLFSARTTETAPDRMRILGTLNETHITFQRYTGTGTIIIEWELVEHPSVYVQRSRQTFGSTDTTSNYTIIDANLSNSFILISDRLNSGTAGHHPRGMWTSQFINSTFIQLQRGTTATAGETAYQVIEWEGAVVQNGSATLTGTTQNSALSQQVDLENTFLVLSSRITGSGEVEETQVGAYFINSTQIGFYRANTAGTVNVNWFAVSFSKLDVQSGIYAYSGSTAAQDISLEDISLDKTFTLSSHSTTTASNNHNRAFMTRKITNSTNLQLQKSDSNGNMNVSWFVISTSSLLGVEIVSPQNPYYTSGDFPILVNVTIDSLGDSVRYTLDNGATNYSLSTTNGFNYNASIASLSEGSYTLRIYATNSEGTENNDEFVNFVVDLNSPQVQLNSPIDDGFESSSVTFNWTATDSLSTEMLCSINLNSEFIASNISSANASSTTYLAENLLFGDYYWNVTCSDAAGNFNTSPTRFFSIEEPNYFVQRGTASVNGEQIISIEKVNTVNSFILLNVRSSSSSPRVNHVSSSFINSSAILLKNYGGAAATVEWEVIEGPGIFVKRGEEVFDSGDSSIDVDLSSANNLSNSFIIVESILDTTTASQHVRGLWTGEFLNSTRISLQRDTTGTGGNVSWQVVSWNGARVENGTTTLTSATNTAPLSNSFDLASSWLIFSSRISGATSLESFNVRGSFNNGSQLSFNRVGTGGTSTVKWFAIEHPLLISQTGSFTISSSSSPRDDLLENLVNITRAFNWRSHSSTGTGTTISNSLVTTSITNETNLQSIIGTGTNTRTVAWQVLRIDGAPTIFNISVFPITGTSATINWNTLSYANSSVNFGETTSLGNISSNSQKNKTHSIQISGLEENILYHYNLTSCNSVGCTEVGLFNFTTFEDDVFPPVVTLVSPENGANITDHFDFNFIFGVDDYSSVSECSLYQNGETYLTMFNVEKNINQTFFAFMQNGIYNWSVGCTDSENNLGFSENRTVNINVSKHSFEQRLWETFDSNFPDNQPAIIRLNNTRDSTQNTVTFNVAPLALVNILNATTHVMGENGAIIPAGTTVTFSSSFTTGHGNLRITRKLFITNITGDFLICQIGDDGAAGTQSPGAGGGTITNSNSTCISQNIRLNPSDRIRLQMNTYNINTGLTRTITHAWDGTTSSYVDVNVTTEGFLNVNLISPTIPQSIGTGDNLNAVCQVYCSIGTCRNTQVYIQQNTSSNGWSNINSSSGNLILASGSNPINSGNVSSAFTNASFSLQGNLESVNNIRCIAVSSYDSQNGSTTTQVNVTTSQVAPVVNLTSPTNNTWFNTQNINLSYNASDVNNNLAGSTLILNGVNNITNQTSLVNGGINNFSITLAQGVYNWTVNVTDSGGLYAVASPTRIFTIDTSAPTFNLSYPNDGDIFSQSSIQFNFTIFDNLSPTTSCNLIIDGSVADSFGANNASLVSRTINDLTIGIHFWNVSCNDLAGNNGVSLTRNFTILDFPPVATLVTANNSFFNTQNINLSYNASDNNGLAGSQLILNGIPNITNQSVLINGSTNNFSITLAQGVYNWTVNVTDSGGLYAVASPTRIFTIDTSAPQINLNLPANNTVVTSSTYSFNFTTIDNLDSSLSCTMYVGESSQSFSATNNTLTNRVFSGLTDGLKVWNVSCVDDAGNTNISENRIINVSVSPTIVLNTANNSFFNVSSFNLSYTPTDNTGFAFCQLYINGAPNITNQSSVINGAANIFSVNLAEGYYNWSVLCEDVIGLQGQSITRHFTVDLDGLTVELLYPNSGDELFTNTINFSYNATDNFSPLLACNIQVNSVVVDSFNATNGAITNRSVFFASGGLMLWNVTCTDDSFNTITSETRNFTLAFAPQVILQSPANNSFQNVSEIVLVYFVSDDNDNIANSTLILNGQVNMTNTTEVANDENNNFTLTLADGLYNWTVEVMDLTGLLGTDLEIRIFTIDTLSPNIELHSPENNTVLDWNNVTLNFTAFDNLDPSLTCSVFIDENADFENFQAINGTNVLLNTLKGDGTYEWYVECFDDSGNYNVSETRVFTVEAPPRVTLYAPTNLSYYNTSTINFVYLPEDAIGILQCSLYLDGNLNQTSSSITPNVNNSFNLGGISEGTHNWTVECTDVFPDFNVFAPTPKIFNVDLTSPVINLSSPLNNSNVLRNVTFNFSAYDNLASYLICNLYIDGNLNSSNINVSNSSSYQTSFGGFSLGLHNWNVSCYDFANNTGFSQNWFFNVTLPDLFVNSSEILFNDSSPKEDDSVLVNATIRNLNNVTIYNVSVRFYEGDPDSGGVQFGTTEIISQLDGLSSINVSRVWEANIGINYIYVAVDRENSIEESNELNNKANSSITTGFWHFIYGEIGGTSQLELADNSLSRIVSWEQVNTNEANIYVADSESTISWLQLQALGRNVSGGANNSDFARLDSFFGSSTFSDSVSNIYTTGGVPNNLSNFMIFNRNITNVPVAYSINNSNFLTGILWDYSTDTNGFYAGGSDKEGVVFFTSVNEGQIGAFGIYDYEIRIPAKLREYYDTNSRTVFFYTEIK